MKKIKDFKYSWFRDKKMIGTIMLILICIVQIFAFLKVPIISSINAYTFGMLVGFYNPLIYIYFTYISLTMIFGNKVQLPKWFKFNKISYLFLVLAIVFIGASPYYQLKTSGFTDIGLKPWRSFSFWFNEFTSTTAWAPHNTNGGFLGVFMYSFFAMISSGVGALIISIVLLVVVISYIATGSFFGLYKQVKIKRFFDLKQKEVKKQKIDDTDSFIDSSITIETVAKKSTLFPEKKLTSQEKENIPFEKNKNSKVSENKIDLPFDDTF